MTKDEIFAAATAHRLALVDQLATLPADQWEAPSLCGDWTVRQVLGHLVSILDVPTWKFVVGTFGIAGFDKRTIKYATQYGAREPSELLARYRELAPTRFALPVVGPAAPLVDVMVHARDIGRPLGLPEVHTAETARTALTALLRGLPAMSPKSRAEGLRFEADDLDWSAGAGATVRGSSGDLALALCGRVAACDGLHGDGVQMLRARLR